MLNDEQRAAGWIEHDGGVCPVKDVAAIPVIRKGGEEDVAPSTSPHWNWRVLGLRSPGYRDIIASRPEPKP